MIFFFNIETIQASQLNSWISLDLKTLFFKINFFNDIITKINICIIEYQPNIEMFV